MRILFLQHKYNSSIDYSTAALDTARDVEKLFMDFFANVKVEVRNKGSDGSEKWTESDKALNAAFNVAKETVHEALQNNFNTPEVMLTLQALVRDANVVSERTCGRE
eukprot:TRINITY_DN273_c1_g1_i5.p2 TRINITY_DN273_c1_g1~~TRINITY_DN273_c1_g1_i5.p2  ORF type:complete len:107 (+),score=40.98 TRINITY_DN273_c1_g1_i5:130-450(+)